MKKVVITICLGVLGFACLAGADTITISTDADAGNYNGTPDTNYGTGNFNLNAGASKKGFFHFDVSAIPAGSTINSVQMKVYVNWVQASDAYYVKLYKVDNEWAETEVTWNNRKTGIAWNTPGGDYSTLVGDGYGLGSTKGWKTVAAGANLVNLVQGWLDGTIPNYGVVLQREGSSGGQRGLDSREGGNAAYLSIDYTPVPEPATIGLLTLGMFGLFRNKK